MKIKIGIIGAGAMGSGIAQIAASNDHQVYIYDNNLTSIDISKQKMQKILARLVEKERISAEKSVEIFSNLNYTVDMNELSDCKMIIEAIIENLDIKKQVFSQLESIVSEDCIIATNTSSLSISSIAAACQKSERIIGIHFFNPAPIMKLTEIIPALQTSDNTLITAKRLIDSWGKVTVVTKDTPGFIVNRIARPYYSEALRIYEEGVASFHEIDDAMITIGGFRMGPFQLMDYIGNDVNYAVTKSVWTSFYYEDRYKPSFTQKRLADAGFLGRKSGQGYYNYSQKLDSKESTHSSISIDQKQQIFNRIIIMLINEAYDALFWNIATPIDIDNAMTKGVNYPKGLLKWGEELGLKYCVDEMDKLYDLYHEDRYRCSVGLRRAAAND